MTVTAVRSALPIPLPARPTPEASAVDLIAARQIAAILYKRDARNPRAILEDLDKGSQEKYIDAAMVAIRQVDEGYHVPALYAAVEAGDRFEGGSGIETMAKDVRIHELGRFELSLRAYRKSVASNDSHARARFQTMAAADRQR